MSMDSGSLDPRPYIATGVVGLITAFFHWLARRAIKRVDNHGDRLMALEMTYISRTELQGHMDRIQADRQRMHEENLKSMAEMRDSLQQVNTNIVTILSK
jgi:hypothetical protein